MSLQDRSNPLFFQRKKKKKYSPQCRAAIPRCSETNTQSIRIFATTRAKKKKKKKKKTRQALLFSPFSHASSASSSIVNISRHAPTLNTRPLKFSKQVAIPIEFNSLAYRYPSRKKQQRTQKAKGKIPLTRHCRSDPHTFRGPRGIGQIDWHRRLQP